jgi:uncharacterized protein
MIVLDANLLLYAYDRDAPENAAAKRWLAGIFSGTDLVGLPWLSVWAFLRLITNSRIFANSIPMSAAIQMVEQWMARPNVRLLSPGEHHWSILRQLLIDANIRAAQTTDAQIAAIAIEFGGVLYTTDRGFARFPGLRWVNPLIES